MSIVDLILLFLVSLFAIRGYFKGLVREIFSLLGLLFGFMVTVRYGELVLGLWQDYWKISPIVLKAVGFITLFLAVYFAFSLTGWLLHRSLKFLFLVGLNRVGGILLGTGKGAALLALILFLLGSSPLIPKQTRQRVDDSYLALPLYRFGQGLFEIGRDTLFPPEGERKSNGGVSSFF
ncbi:MAG: CvpA family protein [Candidatus Binatia bacterium]